MVGKSSFQTRRPARSDNDRLVEALSEKEFAALLPYLPAKSGAQTQRHGHWRIAKDRSYLKGQDIRALKRQAHERVAPKTQKATTGPFPGHQYAPFFQTIDGKTNGPENARIRRMEWDDHYLRMTLDTTYRPVAGAYLYIHKTPPNFTLSENSRAALNAHPLESFDDRLLNLLAPAESAVLQRQTDLTPYTITTPRDGKPGAEILARLHNGEPEKSGKRITFETPRQLLGHREGDCLPVIFGASNHALASNPSIKCVYVTIGTGRQVVLEAMRHRFKNRTADDPAPAPSSFFIGERTPDAIDKEDLAEMQAYAADPNNNTRLIVTYSRAEFVDNPRMHIEDIFLRPKEFEALHAMAQDKTSHIMISGSLELSERFKTNVLTSAIDAGRFTEMHRLLQEKTETGRFTSEGASHLKANPRAPTQNF